MPRFKSVVFEDDQRTASAEIIMAAENFATWVESEVVECRERSLALTKLEEAVMWANKAISNGSLKSRI